MANKAERQACQQENLSKSENQTAYSSKQSTNSNNTMEYVIPQEKAGNRSGKAVLDKNGAAEQTVCGSEVPAKVWSQKLNNLLRRLILNEKQYDWKILSKALGFTVQETISYWQQEIYPKLKSNSTVGGALKWSPEEDSIMMGYEQKYGLDWNSLLVFLPSRSEYSIEGRFRRLSKEYDQNSEMKPVVEEEREGMLGSKHKQRKDIIKLVATINQTKKIADKQQQERTINSQ